MFRPIVPAILPLALAGGLAAAQGGISHARAATAAAPSAPEVLPVPPIPPATPPAEPAAAGSASAAVPAIPPSPPPPPATLPPATPPPATPPPATPPPATPANAGAATPAGTPQAAPPMPAISAQPPPPPVLPPPPAVPTRPAPPPPPPAISDGAPGEATPIPGGLRLTFGSGRADLNPAGAAAVRKLAAEKAESYTVTALAPAVADDGSAARRLSLARGLAVRSLLIERGVPSERIYVKALGDNAAAIGSAPPDRVDIILAPEPAPPGKARP
jgi:outer membrane protein OmpA-like peptidoglycan-associated protein